MTVHEKNVLYTFTAIRQGLFRFLKKELEGSGIESIAPSHGDILFVLDRRGPLSLQDLARSTVKDKSTVSSVVKKLEKSGYILKSRDPSDFRRTFIRLAPRAEELREVLYGISDRMNKMLFRGFTEREKRTLFRLLEKMSANL